MANNSQGSPRSLSPNHEPHDDTIANVVDVALIAIECGTTSGVEQLEENSNEAGAIKKTKSMPMELELELEYNHEGPSNKSAALMVNTHKRPFFEGENEVSNNKMTKEFCSLPKDPATQESEINVSNEQKSEMDLSTKENNGIRDFDLNIPASEEDEENEAIVKENEEVSLIDGLLGVGVNQVENHESSLNVVSEIAKETTNAVTDENIGSPVVKENELELSPIDGVQENVTNRTQGENGDLDDLINQIAAELINGLREFENEELALNDGPQEEDDANQIEGEENSYSANNVAAKEIAVEHTNGVPAGQMDSNEAEQPSFEENNVVSTEDMLDIDETLSRSCSVDDLYAGGDKIPKFDLNELPAEDEDEDAEE